MSWDDDARASCPWPWEAAARAVVIGDVSSLAMMKSVAEQANAIGGFHSVIHNVALGTSQRRVLTTDGLTDLFAVNVAAPYVLTALMAVPERLIYLSSGMHAGGDDTLDDPQWETRRWNGSQAYSDTKLYDLAFALLLARRWAEVLVNAVNPGWVPTRMGGRGAPDSVQDGVATQAWLAASDEPAAKVSGCYFHHREARRFNGAAAGEELQERLVDYLERATGISLPATSSGTARTTA